MGDAAVAGDELLEQHGEFLAFLQLALEVDVVGEGADELDHRGRRRARRRCRSARSEPLRSPSTRTMRGLTCRSFLRRRSCRRPGA